jgi:hypothetical protein
MKWKTEEIRNLIKLAFEEKSNWKYYSKAVNQYPNVLWTHTADMIASQILGV